MIVNAGLASSRPKSAACVSGFVTRTPYPPRAKPAGTLAVIVVAPTVSTGRLFGASAGSGPTSAAVAPGRKLRPVIVTSVAIGRYAHCVP